MSRCEGRRAVASPGRDESAPGAFLGNWGVTRAHAAVYLDTPQEVVEALWAGLNRARQGFPTRYGRLRKNRHLDDVQAMGAIELERILEVPAAEVIRDAQRESPFACVNCGMGHETEEKADECCRVLRELLAKRER